MERTCGRKENLVTQLFVDLETEVLHKTAQTKLILSFDISPAKYQSQNVKDLSPVPNQDEKRIEGEGEENE